MPNPRKTARRSPSGAPAAGSDPDDLSSYLELAREIKREVDRLAADDSVGIDAISQVFDRFTSEERARVVRTTFDALAPDQQWAVLERTFGDAEIRDHLAALHAERLEALRRTEGLRPIVATARATGQLDTRRIPVNELLTLGLHREADVRAAVARGYRSETCAREVTLRCRSEGVFQTIDDVFNPRRGYFVNRDYDADTWRSERLQSHALVRVGASGAEPLLDSFEPVLAAGGRVDFETSGQIVRGKLHLGFVLLGETDVFAD